MSEGPCPGRDLVAADLHAPGGIVCPLALDDGPDHLVATGSGPRDSNALEPAARRPADERVGQRHAVEDRTGRIGPHEEVGPRAAGIRAALGREPEAALWPCGDPFEVVVAQRLVGDIGPADGDSLSNDRGMVRDVDPIEPCLAQDRVAHRPDSVRVNRVTGQAGDRHPRDGQAGGIVGADEIGVGRRAAPDVEEGDDRAGGEALIGPIHLRCGSQQTARELHALRADAARQELEQRGAALRDVVDAYDVRALGRNEEQRPTVGVADLEPLRLAPLVLGAGLRVVPGTHDGMLEAVAGLELDRAVGAPDREAAATALHAVLVDVVPLVGRCEAVVIDPLHGVGLAAAVDQRSVQLDGTGPLRTDLLFRGVDVRDVHGAGTEVGDDLRPLQIDDDEVVVLLEGEDRLVPTVDVDILRLRIARRDVGQACQADGSQAPVPGLAIQLDDLE